MAQLTSKNLEELQKQAEKRAKVKDKRKTRKMAVSGKSIFGLQRIIKQKAA